jgi:hypothetical protein
MLTLKDIGRIIKEETLAVLEVDTKIGVPRISPRERSVRDAEKEFFGAYGSEPVEDQPEVYAAKRDAKNAANEKRWADFAEKVRQRTAGPGPQKPVAPEDVGAFKLYKKLHYDLMDLTDEQRLWMAGDVAGRGTIPREVLRQEVPEILDAIEKVENNEVDPDLQDRLSRYQSAPEGETPEEEQARQFQYNRALREFNLWRDKPYGDLNKWLRTSRGMDFAIEYNTFDPGGDEEATFPGGEEAVRHFQQTFDSKIEMEEYLLDSGYSMDQLSHYLQDPEGIYGEK